MRPGELLNEGVKTLSAAKLPSPAADVRTLLAYVCEVEPGEILMLDEITEDQATQFRELISQRVEGTPLQHLTGTAYFRYIQVTVGPGVFVPRPETETMVGWAVDQLKTLNNPVVVELCTGSGAIAKALANEVPAAKIYAVENSEKAFEYAKRNLADTGVELALADMVNAFEPLNGTVDLVISNPPYLPAGQIEQLPTDVKNHDPITALASGEDGLDDIKVVAEVAARLLKPGGWVVVEHGDDQGDSASAIFQGRFGQVQDHPDLTGRPRFVTGQLISETDLVEGRAQGDEAETNENVVNYQLIDCTENPEEGIKAGVAAIRQGECIVIPTDTVYGIGANAFDSNAVTGLLAAKHRGRDMPPPVLIAEPAMLPALADSLPKAAKEVAEAFWPGALTLIVLAQNHLKLDLGDTAGTIAIRVPDHDFTRDLLRSTGPMAVSSANISGKNAPANITEAIEQLGGSVTTYLDHGPTEGSVPSTIVDYSTGSGRVLRKGAISIDELRKIDPDIEDLPEPRVVEESEPPSNSQSTGKTETDSADSEQSQSTASSEIADVELSTDQVKAE